ncbi:MAG TPA: hypothetical protein VD994_20840 [Prosthecobacter sp.]|nr:hypothetical protein [Prosthecobacter sp.]
MTAAHTTRAAVLASMLAFALGVTGCNEKTVLKGQIEEKQTILSEKKSALANIQRSSAATPSTGKTAWTRQSQIQDLEVKITTLDGEIQGLKTHKVAIEKMNREAQDKIDSYLSSYTKPN